MLLTINQYIISPILHYCKTSSSTETKSVTLSSLQETIETLASQPSVTVSKVNTGNSRELTRLYRYSSIGHLLGGLSHELTNLSNGALNYTQAILDLSDDTNLDKDTKQLIEKLFIEEKKMSQLLINMISFTSGSAHGQEKVIPVDDLFDNIKTLVQGTFKSEQIVLNIQLDDPAFMLQNHVSDLQLVILSALQNSRTALNNRFSSSTAQTEKKSIEITLDAPSQSNDSINIEITDNGSSHSKTQDSSTSSQPWHNMSFCKSFLQTFGGTLSLSRDSENTNLCIISIPLVQEKS